jgi:glutaredoxin 3
MAEITMYSTDPCSFCSNAKALLAQRGLEYHEINLGRDPAGRAELVERTGMLSFPQIIIGGKVLGGFRELLEADRTGRLAELVGANGNGNGAGPA